MTYLLDTNACVAVLRDRASNVARRLALETPSRVSVCSVVKAELYYGAFKSQQSAQTFAKLDLFLRAFSSYSFDDQAADVPGHP